MELGLLGTALLSVTSIGAVLVGVSHLVLSRTEAMRRVIFDREVELTEARWELRATEESLRDLRSIYRFNTSELCHNLGNAAMTHDPQGVLRSLDILRGNRGFVEYEPGVSDPMLAIYEVLAKNPECRLLPSRPDAPMVALKVGSEHLNAILSGLVTHLALTTRKSIIMELEGGNISVLYKPHREPDQDFCEALSSWMRIVGGKIRRDTWGEGCRSLTLTFPVT